MKKLSKKAATTILHSIVPGAKIEQNTSYDLIGAYTAKTPVLTVTCVYDHIMPWSHIHVKIDALAPHGIELLYDPETLERDYRAEDEEERAAAAEKRG